jgi:hypothetical protein
MVADGTKLQKRIYKYNLKKKAVLNEGIISRRNWSLKMTSGLYAAAQKVYDNIFQSSGDHV